MRKHNKKFATRFGRTDGDRTNFPQNMAHSLSKNKAFHLASNALLQGMLKAVL